MEKKCPGYHTNVHDRITHCFTASSLPCSHFVFSGGYLRKLLREQHLKDL